MVDKIALIAAVLLPLFNIPFILTIIKSGSSKNVSISWAFGVWICLILMLPASIISADLVWQVFNILNLILFTLVVITVMVFRKKEPGN